MQRQVITADVLREIRENPDPYHSLLSQWQRLVSQTLPVPIGNSENPDSLDDWITLASKPALVYALLDSLLYPDRFVDLPIEILGQAYEVLLNQTSSITSTAVSFRKVGGVYYTPISIVSTMVESAIQQGTTGSPQSFPHNFPQVLDPSCGSGGFLLAAYQSGITQWAQSPERSPQFILELLSKLHGVDIDPIAVAVAQLSLLLKTLEVCPALKNTDIVPILTKNLRCGNAVIAPDFDPEKYSKINFKGTSKNNLKNNPKTLTRTGSHQSSNAAIPILSSTDQTITQTVDTRPFCWHSAFPDRLAQGGFDLVIGNPPYVDAEWMSIHQPHWRTYCTDHYQTATGNWDLFCIFIEKSLQLCRIGGWVSLIVPNKLLSADYAQAARHLLTRQRLVSIHDYAQVPIFAASVYPIVYLMQKVTEQNLVSYQERGKALSNTTVAHSVHYMRMQSIDQIAESHMVQLPEGARSPAWMFSPASPIQHLESLPRWGDYLPILGAATVGEAYSLQALIQENSSPQNQAFRMINSGTIDRYQTHWGSKPLRYLGQKYQYPVVAEPALQQWSMRRFRQACQQKLIVAGIGQHLEATIDPQGQILAGKSTTIILLPDAESRLDLRYLLGLLNSRLLSEYFRLKFSGNRLRNGYFRISPPQLRHLPIVLPDWNSPHSLQRYFTLIDLVNRQLELLQQLGDRMHSDHPHDRFSQEIDREIDRCVEEIYYG
ncbi:MAG: N-6 DNA methylase [Elainella sp. Prado103]|jgi:hypothetical protein|nr:N-6 DNA methylase [Elainella sp. Prado103]